MTKHDTAPQWGARDDQRIGLEKNVVGTALLNPQQYAVLAEHVTPGMLRHAPARLIWDLLSERIPEGLPTDYVALQLAISETDLKRIGGPAALAELGNWNVADARWHAEELRKLHVREQLAAKLRGALARVEQEGDIDGALSIVSQIDETAPGAGSDNPTQQRLAQLRAALVDSEGLDTIPDPVPLIDGVLFLDSLAWLYGKPGSGKSFVALDWAGCIANGMPWQLREVSRGSVLYLVAEGVSGIRKRVRAWEEAFHAPMKDVTFLPVAVQLLHGTDRQALLALVGEMKPALVVVDTQARVTVGADENSNGEMSKVVDAADQIRQASGACVLMVHHSGKNGLDLRGASAFEGAATSIIKVGKDKGQWVDVISDKQKDVEDFQPIRLCMTPMGSSIVLRAGTGEPAATETTRSEEGVLATLRDHFGTTSATGPQLMEVAELPKSTFYRALNGLVERGAVRNLGSATRPRYALPETSASDESHSSPTQSHGTGPKSLPVPPPYGVGLGTTPGTGQEKWFIYSAPVDAGACGDCGQHAALYRLPSKGTVTGFCVACLPDRFRRSNNLGKHYRCARCGQPMTNNAQLTHPNCKEPS
ncbi:AAA family ATPase [Streptomyces sp. NPDC006967]|uniref:AAA family ATPase n=1 Tax=Streptomyces sp. NPDC006967 TaxID=3156906 RepID=UPI0033FC9F55